MSKSTGNVTAPGAAAESLPLNVNAVGVAHFDAATGGVTLATAVTDAPCEPISLAVTWFWWFSVTAVATPPITTTAAVANDVMASTRRLPPRHALIVKPKA